MEYVWNMCGVSAASGSPPGAPGSTLERSGRRGRDHGDGRIGARIALWTTSPRPQCTLLRGDGNYSGRRGGVARPECQGAMGRSHRPKRFQRQAFLSFLHLIRTAV